MMKLLFCHDHTFLEGMDGTLYSPGQFGPESWKRYLEYFDRVDILARKKKLVAPEQKGNLLAAALNDNVNFLSTSEFRHKSLIPFSYVRRSKVVRNAVYSADAVVARLPSTNGLLSVHYAEIFKRPYAIEVVGCAWASYWNHGSYLGRLYAPWATWHMRRAVQRAPYVLYVTREFLQRKYPTSGVQGAASNVQISFSPESVLPRRIKQNRQRRKRIIGLIGSLQTRYKGVQTALEALSRIKHSISPFEFRVLGHGNPAPWKELASRFGIAEQTKFCGSLPSGQPVMRWLDDVDLYIQPSFTEGLPRSLIEAMSRGCAALGSTVGGIPELLASEALHRPGDAEKLGELIKAALNDVAWLDNQSKANIATACRYQAQEIENARRIFWGNFYEFALAQR